MVEVSAPIVTTILFAIAIYQTALAAGAPLAETVFANDGRGRAELAEGCRVVGAVAAGVTVLAAYVVAARGELVSDGELDDRFLRWGTGIVGVYLAVNALTDLASANVVKRWRGSAAKIVAAAMCAVVVTEPS